MLRIGLTGGIGSGKSAAASHFSSLGIEVIDADEIVHRLSAPGQDCFSAILKQFGKGILNTDGSINRQALGQMVFNDSTARKKLEAILHPAVRNDMEKAVQEALSPYCILVIPLLVETGFTDIIDRVLVVSADIQTRLERVKHRSKLSQEQIESIMNTQANDEERREFADDVIENNGSLDLLHQQVKKLDRKYRNLAEKSPKALSIKH